MNKPTFNWEISVSTLIHLGTMIAIVAIAYAGIMERTAMLENRFNFIDAHVKTVHQQTDRIEHYLSSRDADYWKHTTENGDRPAELDGKTEE